ncbi:DUF975 family protein [Mariniplasma anaerobium]|uniref:DUF975 family protein n=1 Tax=Mariniplasma anaerobium TaxID=2735436 RepID=A0A7U9XVJ5_9MOLU|nr:DUF975 family protein [Mariniplasma anaerobium]BCR35359.1 hypothetical protein MPAN_002520 [Mariniplasma anaerobium]
MFMNSKAYRVKTWNQLKKSYWSVLIACLIVLAVSGASVPLAFLLVGPILVGQSYYLIDVAEHENEGKNFELLIEGFKKSLVTSIVANILMGIFIFLWTLLLIIPGIIKIYAYSMTHYVIAENPEIDFMDAIKKSEEMMKGHKFRLFKLQFSFIGWFILGVLTFGVGFLFVYPYYSLAQANFYIDLRGKKPLIIDVDY